jgi:predicted DNA-binding protein
LGFAKIKLPDESEPLLLWETKTETFLMEMIALTPERKAQLDSYAQRHGKDSAEALDEVLADWLEDETKDYQEAVEGIRRGSEGRACTAC